MDRLNATDASFLANEEAHSHMHHGAVAVLAGPPPSYADFLDHIGSSVHLVPRLGQKLAFPPLGLRKPYWIDDEGFDLVDHVRHAAIPAPGSDRQLREIAERVFSERLDRSKPLWELWLVTGLERNRFALITKTHHAMADGLGSLDVATVLFDRDPTAEIGPGGSAPASRATAAKQAPSASLEPKRAQLADALKGLGELARGFRDHAPELPLNVEVGSHRRVLWTRGRLDHAKTIKNAFGGTVNDVVMAVVAGALRRWLIGRGINPDGLELRALVPVSIRKPGEHGPGNLVVPLRAPLPVGVDDPVPRLQAAGAAMNRVKDSKQLPGAVLVAKISDYLPPVLLTRASRLGISPRLFNLLVTNVPGPQLPLQMMGHEVEEIFPIAFLAREHAVAIAVLSYNGALNFGLLADRESMSDLEVIGDGIEQSIAELLHAANARAGQAL